MGKTETIKERAIYVYLPSHEMVKDWKKLAKNQGTSISKFVIEHVESSLRQEKGLKSGFRGRADLIKELQKLEEDNSALKKENRMLKLALEKMDDELRGYRVKPFMEKGFRKLRGFEKELVSILRRWRSVKGEELFDLLHIDPMNTEMTRGVQEQLRLLQEYGLVEPTAEGWRWTER
jgi:hypothetical protein